MARPSLVSCPVHSGAASRDSLLAVARWYGADSALGSEIIAGAESDDYQARCKATNLAAQALGLYAPESTW